MAESPDFCEVGLLVRYFRESESVKPLIDLEAIGLKRTWFNRIFLHTLPGNIYIRMKPSLSRLVARQNVGPSGRPLKPAQLRDSTSRWAIFVTDSRPKINQPRQASSRTHPPDRRIGDGQEWDVEFASRRSYRTSRPPIMRDHDRRRPSVTSANSTRNRTHRKQEEADFSLSTSTLFRPRSRGQPPFGKVACARNAARRR